MTKTHQIPVRVYLEDTDAGGVVYHGSYVRFMERCRTEWLRAVGLEQSATFEQGISFVVHQLNLTFTRPAKLDQQLWVSCALEQVTAATLAFRQEVRDQESAGLFCTADVRIACIDPRSLRPRRIPAELRAHLADTQPSRGSGGTTQRTT